MRPQDCRRSQWPCCKRCGRSGRPARLLTGRDAAAIVSCAATAESPAPSALPPKVGSALAMPLSSACTPLATAATPRARQDPTPSRSQVGTRCTASTATASCRRHPSWTAGYPPCQLVAALHLGRQATVRASFGSDVTALCGPFAPHRYGGKRKRTTSHVRKACALARQRGACEKDKPGHVVDHDGSSHSFSTRRARSSRRTCQLAPEAPPSPDRAFQDRTWGG